MLSKETPLGLSLGNNNNSGVGGSSAAGNKGQKIDKKMLTWKKVIKEIWNNEDSLEFRVPVDFVGMQLLDYPLLVPNPMDLSTVKKKLRAQKYHSNNDLACDIMLIWSNCMTYNKEGSSIYRLA